MDCQGTPVALFNVDGEFFAIEDVCTHDGGGLAEAELHGDVVVCPRHGARFDVKTGAVRTLPAHGPVPVYQVRVEGGDIPIAPK